jgi:DNA-binding SARP family transcriptional activator/tetratricopeptide (TPR) repeat protein
MRAPVPGGAVSFHLMMRLRLQGEPVLLDGAGHIVSLWKPELALLAVLALSRPGIRRERAASLLWPQSDGRRARTALRQALFRLRRTVGPVVEASGGRLRLDSHQVEVDVLDLERALDEGRWSDAVDLRSGPFLEGFHLDGSPAFQQWVDGRQAAWDGRMGEAFREAVRGAEAEGDWPRALARARSWAAFAPLGEEAAGACVRLLHLLGDRGAALDAYHQFRERLHRELEAEPGPELVGLVRRVEAGGRPEPAAGSAPGQIAAISRSGPSPAGPDRVPAPSSGEPFPLVGRRFEFRHLAAAWEWTGKGHRSLVLLSGPMGIGKTRLAREFASAVAVSGATVLEGRGYEMEGETPYAVLAGLLRGALRAPGLAGVDRDTLGELSRIVPDFALRYPHQGIRSSGDLLGGRFRIMDAVRSLLENLAYEAPVLIFLDDLPWADEASLAVLHHAFRTLRGSPILLLCTSRGEVEAGRSAGWGLWTGLAQEVPGAVHRLELQALGPPEIEALAGAGWDVEALERATGGNPLFLVEVLRAGRGAGPALEGGEGGPASLRAVVQGQLRRLDPTSRRFLEAAAVLGPEFHPATAGTVAGLPPVQGARACADLVDVGLLRASSGEGGVPHEFAHELVREVIRAEVPGEVGRLLHAAAYTHFLPAEGGEADVERSGALARHAEGAGDLSAAFRWSLRAAARARDVFAADEAEAHLARARALAASPEDQGEAWRLTAELRRLRSRFGEAAWAYLQALAATTPGDPLRLGLRLGLLECSVRGGLIPAPQVLADLAGIVEDARRAGEGVLHGEAHATAALVLAEAGRLPEALEEARRAVELAEGDPHRQVRALLLEAQTALRAERWDRVLPALDRAVDVAEGSGLSTELCDARSDRGTELARLGNWNEAVEEWKRGLESAVSGHEFAAETVLRFNLADLLARRGHRHDALRHLGRVEELCRRFGFSHVALELPINRAVAAWFAGDPPGAAAEAEVALRTLEASSPPPEGPGRAVERVARAFRILALTAGEPDPEALGRELHALRALGTSDHPSWSDDRELVALALSRGAATLGDMAGARAALKEALSRTADPFGRGVLLLELSARTGGEDPRQARRLAAEGEGCLRRLGVDLPPERMDRGTIPPPSAPRMRLTHNAKETP